MFKSRRAEHWASERKWNRRRYAHLSRTTENLNEQMHSAFIDFVNAAFVKTIN